MRRSAIAVALLLATAPVAGATEVTPDAKPELRAVEVAAPKIRTEVAVVPSHGESRNAKAAAARQFSTRDLTLVAVVLLVVLIALAV